MSSNSSSPSDQTRQAVLSVIHNFSNCLKALKDDSISLPGISEQSKKIMSEWGKIKDEIPFYSQGPDTSTVFIIDKHTSFFSGAAGQLLIKILAAMNLSKESVYICNCQNMSLVTEKINQIQPRVIISLGEEASSSLLGEKSSFETIQGKFQDFNSIKVMPTYHPELLIKDPGFKRQVWEDMKQVIEYAGLKK